MRVNAVFEGTNCGDVHAHIRVLYVYMYGLHCERQWAYQASFLSYVEA
jgi:hypothetical protein